MRRHILGLVAVIAAFLVAPSQVFALADAGVVLSAQGSVSAKAPDGTVRVLERRATVNVGDVLITGADGKAQLRMKDETMLSLGENSELTVAAYSHKAAGDEKDEAVLKLAKGALTQMSGNMEKAAYKLETPVSTLGIRGTIFEVIANADGSWTVNVLEGEVVLEDGLGRQITVPAGKSITSVNGVFAAANIVDLSDDARARITGNMESAAAGYDGSLNEGTFVGNRDGIFQPISVGGSVSP